MAKKTMLEILTELQLYIGHVSVVTRESDDSLSLTYKLPNYSYVRIVVDTDHDCVAHIYRNGERNVWQFDYTSDDDKKLLKSRIDAAHE